MVFYLLAVRPFKDRLNEKSILTGEICIALFYAILILPLITDISISLKQQGVICIFIILANIAFNALFSSISFTLIIYTWIISRKLRRLNLVVPGINAANTEGDQKTSKIVLEQLD